MTKEHQGPGPLAIGGFIGACLVAGLAVGFVTLTPRPTALVPTPAVACPAGSGTWAAFADVVRTGKVHPVAVINGATPPMKEAPADLMDHLHIAHPTGWVVVDDHGQLVAIPFDHDCVDRYGVAIAPATPGQSV